MRARRLGLIWIAMLAATVLGAGCSLAPKNFRDLLAPAPIVRARAVGMEEKQPEAVAVPAMIGRLGDPDPVVRMAANDALKERTHQDFLYVPWASAEERQAAVDRWRGWWADRAKQAAYPRDDELRKVSAQPVRSRKKRRRRDGQGGPAAWPNNSESRPQPSSDPNTTP